MLSNKKNPTKLSPQSSRNLWFYPKLASTTQPKKRHNTTPHITRVSPTVSPSQWKSSRTNIWLPQLSLVIVEHMEDDQISNLRSDTQENHCFCSILVGEFNPPVWNILLTSNWLWLPPNHRFIDVQKHQLLETCIFGETSPGNDHISPLKVLLMEENPAPPGIHKTL